MFEYSKAKRVRNLFYNPKRNKATCKYCYSTHRSWVFDGEIYGDVRDGKIAGEVVEDAWKCKKCNHRIKDDYINIYHPTLTDDGETPVREYITVTFRDYMQFFTEAD